ncbi:MAG: diguanylate cyclase [Deltaproteobacteria bacterium]|nr:diguanylate cyclase [Deltaproteobacteria bacterium]
MAKRVAVLSASCSAVAVTVVVLLVAKMACVGCPAPLRSTLFLVATLGGAASTACVAFVTWLVVHRVLTRPLRRLVASARAAAGGKEVGFMGNLGRRADELGDLSRSFHKLCAEIADLAVTVIDTDRELAQARHELKLKQAIAVLFELTQKINAESDLDAILRAIPRKVAPAMGFEEMAILLRDDRTGKLVVKATYGFGDGEEIEGTTFAPGEGISGLVSESGEPIVINDTRTDPRYMHYKGKHLTDGSLACVPMEVMGRTIGVFNVLRPGAGGFSDQDVSLVRSLASYTALAISHAQKNLRLRDLAVTDELTGVANRRLLMQRLSCEVERARRSGKPLSLLMVDLDHFKRINDEHGHLKGDQVLKAVAAALTTSVRRSDTVARYGGEEFVVLLPDAGKRQAVACAEKLRLAVAEPNAAGIELSVSIGVATLPEDAHHEDDLLDAADRALLFSKRNGRNRVVSYEASRSLRLGA